MNALPRQNRFLLIAISLLCLSASPVAAQRWIHLTEVPDYGWYAGCFGTASGNLAGFWDRHGFTNFYSGPTGGGVAPLNSLGANVSIRSLWVSKAGVDGRPANQFGHIDDYYSSGDGNVYDQSTKLDPYVLAGRAEHAADCIGDFIGLNQRKWTDMAGECDGNIDAYSFAFWDKTGNKRINYSHTNISGQYIPDLQSGYKAWARWRGYDADVFTQLTDFNPERTTGAGFTYQNVKAEIDAGYPVLCFLQRQGLPFRDFSSANPPMPKANPEIHGVMIYGYVENVAEVGATKGVVIRTSWGSGDNQIMEWDASAWLGLFPVRGVIGFHPKPKITSVTRSGSNITISWDGPSAQLYDNLAQTTTNVHRYQLEGATSLSPSNFKPVGSVTTARTATVSEPAQSQAFYRVRLNP